MSLSFGLSLAERGLVPTSPVRQGTRRPLRQRLRDLRQAGSWDEFMAAVMDLFCDTYGRDASRWYHRWHIFFLACEELFGFGGSLIARTLPGGRPPRLTTGLRPRARYEGQ